MFGITKINVRRTSILLSIFLLGIFAGNYLGSSGAWRIVEKTLNTESVNEALNKPTQNSTVNNNLKIDKIKKADTLTVNFNPKTDQKPLQVITSDSCTQLRLKIKTLTKSQKRKFDRW